LRQGLLRSDCAALVAVVKSANLRYGKDGSECRRVHGPRFRCVFGQGEVRPGFVIIRREGLHVPVVRSQNWIPGAELRYVTVR
jgi:hypothetical protein